MRLGGVGGVTHAQDIAATGDIIQGSRGLNAKLSLRCNLYTSTQHPSTQSEVPVVSLAPGEHKDVPEPEPPPQADRKLSSLDLESTCRQQ